MKHFLRISIAVALLTCSFMQSRAQGSFTYALPLDGAGTTNAETARMICTDASGNLYCVGVFNGAADFDITGAGVNNFPSSISNDGYIVSYDMNGNFRWKTIVSGSSADFGAPSGGICTNGTYVWFTGSVNMTGSPQVISATNTVTLTSPGANLDVVVGKLNCSNGGVVWAQAFGGSTATNLDFGEGICVDPSGCCYVTGSYAGTFTLNSITTPVPSGNSDFFIAKFTPSGVMRSFNSGGAAGATDMIGVGSGLCYVPGAAPALVATGHTGAGTAAFGAFTNLLNSGGNDALLLELDTTLGYTNALVFGSASNDELISDVYDPYSGAVFVCGYDGGGITFPGTAALTNGGGQDATIARYSVATNNFVWSAAPHSPLNDRGWSITSDGQGGILMSGHTAGAPCTFSGSVVIGSNAGANDLYVVRYTPNGTPVWVLSGGGAGGDEARSVASYVQTTPSMVQNIFITGIFQATSTMGSNTLTADGGNDFFVARINDANLPLTATQSQVNLTCNGVCTGSATVVASGGTAPYTYSWSPSGGSGATASSLCALNYTCTITDATLTSITKTFSITQPPALVITPVSQTNVACSGGANGAAQVSVSGGTGTPTYNWTPGSPTGDGTASVTGLTAQVYTVTVTDANSCVSTRTFNITSPSAISVTPSSQTNVGCLGGATGAASINLPTGGAGGYTYNWTPGSPTGDGTRTVTGLTAQVYTVTVTDANGCTAAQTFNITQPSTTVSGTIVKTNVMCFGGNTGALNLTPSGGTPGYTFNWLPSGPTTEDRTNLTAGTYSVQITDANGCTGTVTATLTQPAAPVSGSTVVTNVACFGGTTGAINLTPSGGTPGYTFNWSSGPTTEDRTNLAAGTYGVQITDANGCTGTVSATVTQPTSPVSGTTVVTNIACFGGNTGAINLTPTGGTGPYTFNWLPSGPTTEDRTGLAAGTYSVQITDANGCNGTLTVSVTQPTSPVSGTTVVTNIACFGGNTGAINLTPTGGTGPYTFNWLPSGPTTEDRTGLAAGTYSVQITDANGCNGTVTVSVTQPAVISVSALSQTNVSCNGGSNGAASINTPTGGAGGYTYNWAPGSPTGDGTTSVTGLTAGTWTCTVTDANSCTSAQTFNITAPSTIIVSAASQTNVTCFGSNNGTAAINTPTGGAGSYTYDWTPGNPTGDGTTAVSNLNTGTWTCTVTDANSCTSSQTFSITQPPVLAASVTITNVSCSGGNNGSVTVNASGGTSPYSYVWNPTGQTTTTISNLVVNCYTVTVTDANGCFTNQVACVTQPAALSVSSSASNVSCNSGNNGSATVSVLGGTPAYSYSWLPFGGNAATASGLTAGTYTCNITDGNSCTISTSLTITEPNLLMVTDSSTDITCFGSGNGQAWVTATGATSPYTYSWSPTGGNAASATSLGVGIYMCTTTDANGCTYTSTFTINEPNAITPNGTQSNISCSGGGNGNMMVSPSGGTGTYTYSWAPVSNTTNVLNGTPAGLYTCTITDANGCTATQTFNLTEPAALSSSNMQSNVQCNGGNNGDAMVMVSGGVPAYTYSWSPSGGNSDMAMSLSAGTYSCLITDVNGCSLTETFTITEPSALGVTATQTDVLCNSTSNGSAMVTVSGGTPSYTYAWSSGGNGATESSLTAGSYTCTITDGNSCSATQTFIITEPAAISTNVTQVDVLCNGGNDGSIDLTVTGGTSPYSFDWNSGQFTTEDLTGLTAGTYSGVLTDANGCTDSGVITITEPAAISVNATQVDPTGCTSNDGSIDITVSGGTAGYSYLWNNASALEDQTSLDGGIYTVDITDANGCTSSAMFTLTEPGAPTVTYSEPVDSACQTTTVSFALSGESPSGGLFTGPGVSSGIFDPMTANIGYNVVTYSYTDAGGCSGVATDSIWVDLCMDAGTGNAEELISVYPNPTSGNFTVNCAAGSVITVYNNAGQLVTSVVALSASTQMDIHSADGIYLVRVESENTVTTHRIVIQR